MSTTGGFEGDSLDIYVRGHDEASSSFESAWSAAEKAGAGITNANQKIADGARAAQAAVTATSRAIEDSGSRLVEVGGRQMRVIDDLKARFAGIGEAARTATRAAAGDIEGLSAELAALNRALQAIKDDARTGIASPQQRVNVLEGLRTQALGGQDRDTLQGRYQAGDQEGRARYTQLVAIERELQSARKQTADVTKAAAAEEAAAEARAAGEINDVVKERTTTLRDQVRLRQISLEQEGEALNRLKADYAAYGDAVSVIDRRITANQVEQLRERTRAQREQGGGRADALLNAGYLIPGPIGNAATNLGYLGMGGPTALAIGGAAIAGIGAASGIADVAKVAGQDQDALERLKIAIKDQGGSWETASKQIEEFLDLQTRTTTFGRDQTLPALQLLVDGGVKYGDALKIVRVAEDASAGSGKSLTEVATGLQRAYEGQPRALTALGLATRDQIRDGMSFSDVLKLIETRYGDQATATDTYARSQKQFQNAVADLERTIGTGLLPVLTDAVRGTTDFVNSLDGAKIGDAVAKNLQQVSSAIGTIAQAAKDAKPFLDQLDKGLNDLQKDSEESGRTAGNAFRSFLGSGGGASGVDELGNVTYGRATATPAPANLPNQYDATIRRYSAQFGVDPALARAVLSQESSMNPNAVSPAGALGLGGLMPDTARGLGVTNAFDPDQNIKGSIEYLGQQLKTFSGDVRLALTAYNSGPGNVRRFGMGAANIDGADSEYVAHVLSRLGPSLSNASALNPVDTNVSDGQRIGGARGVQSPFQQSLTSARLTELGEQQRGIEQFRQNYIEALQAIASQQRADASDATKSSADQATARKNLLEVETKIAAETRAENTAATAALRLAEQRLTLTERNADTARRAQQSVDPVGAFQREIGTLSGLQAQRGAANDQFSARDVDAIGAKIQQLEAESAAAWQRALADAGKYYRDTSETLDEYIAKVRSLERGASPDQKTAGEAAITSAIESSVTKTVTDLETEYRRAVENGLSRAGQEALARKDLGILASTANRGDATAASTIAGGAAQLTSDLGGNTTKDAADAVSALSRQYKELDDAVEASNAAQSTKDAELASLTSSQIAALVALGKQYEALRETGTGAYASIEQKIAELAVTEQQQLDEAARAEREELQKRAEAYQQFADTASEHLASLFDRGAKGANGFRDAFKSAIKDMEQSLVSNSIESALFGVQGSASTSPLAALQKAFFGAVDPSLTQSKSSVSDAALQKIANSPTGDTNNPLTVQLTPAATQALTGSSTGVTPGSATAAAATGSGGLSSILGSGSGLGGLLGLGVGFASSLFGGGGSSSNQPDRTNTTAYGQTIADLTGSAGANGQNFYEDPATEKAFGGLSGIGGVERLLSYGPAAFTQQTGLSAAQYQQYVQMFGVSSTGSGTLNFNPNNIGVESVSGASGASGSYTYEQFSKALLAVESGISTLGTTGPINSYTFSRGYPNYDQIGSPTNGQFLPTQVTGGPGYSGPNVSDITSGASQYGLVGGILGARGGSSIIGALSTGAGVIGLLLGTQTAQQITSQNTSTSGASASALTNSNDVILGAIGTSATGSASGSTGDPIADAIAASLGATGGYSASASSSVGANGGLGAIASLFGGGGGGSGIGTSGGIAGGSGLGGLGGGLGSLLDKLIPPTASGDVYDQDGNLLSSGGISSASGSLGSVLSGLGLGIGLNSILGGNSTNGAIGSALGAGVGLIGGPVGSLIGGGLGGILGGLFGNHTTPAGSPDIYNTKQYGGIIADLVGNSQANGLLSYEDSQTYKAFNGQTGLAGVEELLSGGQAAFTQETGLSAAQYAQYVKMFGESSTGSGTLDAEKNIGQRYVTGATGATGVYSYTQYGQALAAIESGLSATGVVGPYDSYTFSRSYPNYNAGTLTAGANSTTSPAKIVTGSGSTTVGTSNASTDAAHISPIAGGLGAVSLTITNPIFVGSSSETAATLASLIQKAQQGQSKGLLTNTATNTYARTPTV